MYYITVQDLAMPANLDDMCTLMMSLQHYGNYLLDVILDSMVSMYHGWLRPCTLMSTGRSLCTRLKPGY